MGREVFIAVLCCLALGDSLAKEAATKRAKDSESAASATRLYRDVPVGVYASAAPHGAYSFQIPTFAQIKSAASHLAPVKEETAIIQNSNGVLKDSYGNRFVETPQNVAFRTTFPQQFVQLQDLPLHLSQPLSAASPNVEYKPVQFVIGPHYKLPIQAAPERYGVPVRFSENLRNYAPPQGFGVPQSLIPVENSGQTNGHGAHVNQQSAAPSQKFARINYAAPYNYGSAHSFAPAINHFATPGRPKAEHQPTSNQAIYANVHAQQQHGNLKSEPKFQRIVESPRGSQPSHQQNANLQESPTKHAIATVVNGKKTIVNVETKPPIPLLDLSLLEPLTFKNPLVPQVQHFLPRIHQATYHKLPNVDEAKNYQKEFMIKKTKSYDSRNNKVPPQKDVPKKKENKPQAPSNREELVPHQKAVPHRPTLDDTPEITYEINMPGYKETVKEQALSYNKETKSDPVHYTYGSETEKEPVTYSYVHHSKEPLQVQKIHYQSNGKGPMQLIYNFKPEEKHIESSKSLPHESEDSGESEELEQERSRYQSAEQHNPHPQETPRNYDHSTEQEQSHRDKGESHPHNYNESDEGKNHQELKHPEGSRGDYKPNQAHHEAVQKAPEYYPQALHAPVTTAEYHPLTQYEEEIQFLPPAKAENIRVDPYQHIQNQPPLVGPSPTPSQAPHSTSAPHDAQFNPTHPHTHGPSQIIQEKTKRIIIQEESPEEMHSLAEQLKAQMIDDEENNEENFEKAYKNAAVGFPAYDRQETDEEKDIYNPESYGIPREHSSYIIDQSPFQQYQREGDEFPKEARSYYKDARDNMKEDYFLDYSVNKPASLTDRYTNKANYYKLYRQQKPENFLVFNEDDKKEKSAKYSAIPYDYPAKEQKPKEQYFTKYKAAPNTYEYDYSKQQPKDNSAHASRPFQRLRSKTMFVEPQFQYGFEPIAVPRLLLDSELAAMASNDSPESEKPGMRKKMYKENWYIKKMKTIGGQSAS